MTIGFQTIPCAASLVSRLDPRWKLASFAVLLVAVTAAEHVFPTALFVGTAFLFAAMARLPRPWYFRRLGAALGFIVVFAVPLPFLLGEPYLWTGGPMHVSEPGTILAVKLIFKVAIAATLVIIVLATAPLEVTLKAMHALHVPGLLAQLVLLTYRYVFVLMDEFARLRVAVRVRGYRHRFNSHSYRTVGHVAGTLLVRGYERSERVGQAMRCRGFDGRFRSLTTFHTTTVDVVAFVVVLTASVGVGLLDYWLQ
jgi:cobalt/nickel transport system permease protein